MTDGEEIRYYDVLREAFHSAPIRTQLVRQDDEGSPNGELVRITLHVDARYHHGGGSIHGGILGLLVDNAGLLREGDDQRRVLGRDHRVQGEPYRVGRGRRGRGDGTRAAQREGISCTRRWRSRERARREGRAAVGLGSYTILPRKFRGM